MVLGIQETVSSKASVVLRGGTVRAGITIIPHSTEKAARKDEAWFSLQPLEFPFSAPKLDACSLSKDL